MIAAVRILNFSLRVAVLQRPELDGAPLVLGPVHGERPKVLDRTPEAATLGVKLGMTMRDAIAIAPMCEVISLNPVRDDIEATRILTALESLSPFVEPDADDPGCWYLDLHGLDRLLGEPATVAGRILNLIPSVLRPRIGLADGKFPARVAAGRAAPGHYVMIPPEFTTQALATEPIASLPAPVELLQRFERLGISTLGALAGLEPGALAARFGPAGRRLHALAAGKDREAVAASRPQTVIIEQLTLPDPTASRDILLYALRLLVARASNHPVIQHRGARRVRIRAMFERGDAWEKQIALKDPARGDRLYELLRLRFQALELPQPVAELAIELSGMSAEAARQQLLDGLRVSRKWPLIEAARQLKSRYGASPLFEIVEVEPWSRIPERRHALMPFDP
ncbi:MAG: DNA polymerase Y family protein [Thermomicrobiales bacterium]|nr:DNA polymerase Y family protein [Thermomicrobiales bacterium]